MTSIAAVADTPYADATCMDGVDLHAHWRSGWARRCRLIPHPRFANASTRLQTALRGIDALICYAAKANSNIAILQLMAEAGLGADIVSSGEMRRSLRAGIPAERIVFSGVGKSADEIVEALTAGIARFNVESEDELHLLQRLAAERNVIAHASVRINPDVDALTHAKISTGKSENKFGVSIDEARRWFDVRLTHVRLDGLHVHIGSQMLTLDPIHKALQRVAGFWRELAAGGHAIDCIDVGGGLGVRYRAGRDHPVAIEDYARVIRHALGDFGGRILLEPGRWLVAEAGILLTRVIRIKHGRQRHFLIVDAAMTDLLRPSLYDAWHDIVPVTERTARAANLRCRRTGVRIQRHLRARP